MTPSPTRGLHHVTALAGAPQRNLDFYAGFLGLRLVKRTVNFDDPGTYHFYYGDATGRPGTILTFFPWPDAVQGRAGVGAAAAVAFSIPEASFDYWMNRFADEAHDFDAAIEPFGAQVLRFEDPDGLALELVAHAGAGADPAWAGGPVPAQHTLRSFYGTTLCLARREGTAQLLTETFGYEAVGEEEGRLRLRAPGDAPATVIDLVAPPEERRARLGASAVHHVAFRARSEDEQRAWREALLEAGFQVTDVRDRQYFTSIYFREPGGVLFEIATDGPGFLIDEPEESLGTTLQLPPWLEAHRERLEERLPALTPPPSASAAPPAR